ncbi:hypothetical protein D7X96_35660 [Corallococcus interemptor]|uniref:DUF3396 domain-containing protein n=1 Tax=Corallococcus interemptor TaxID=2316720 RepID=A0A3A8PZM1_9BACT|nr:DUF5953 family protein [Corallococcus interemptor]RKH49292.1 hypothetical protein D7Y23_17460 [Corallococcus sp. AB050B]RKH59235.1 hypothetical protein D7X96_35660 [Corallococcus interemptor]
MTTRSRLHLTVYAPAMGQDDNRSVAVARGMELALAGLSMAWRLSKEGHPIALPQRDAWLAEAATRRKFPMLCNGDESYAITVSGLETPASQAPGARPLLDVHASLPLDARIIEHAVPLLMAIAERAHAYWGHMSEDAFGLEISEQLRRSADAPKVSPRGLPMLEMPEHLRSPAIPHFLGWLNYWSEAAAQAIGFPDAARDSELLSRSRRTPSGGWVVQLTEAPLDYGNPEHIEALRRAYERFPAIGGRDSR